MKATIKHRAALYAYTCTLNRQREATYWTAFNSSRLVQCNISVQLS